MFENVKQAISQASSEDLYRLLEGDLQQSVEEIFACVNRLQVEAARRVAELDRRSGSIGVLIESCRMSGPEVRSRRWIAEMAEELPEARAAAAAGEIGYEHLKVICGSAKEIGLDAFREGGAESILVDCARRVDARTLRWATRRLRNLVKPEDATQEASDSVRDRWVHLSESMHGIWFLNGRLDAEAGALLQAALEAAASPVQGRNEGASAARADALVELARRALASGELGTTGGVRPHLMLTSSIDAVAGRPSVGGEMEWVGPVCGEIVRRLACDASVTVVEVDAHGDPLSVGRARRTVPPALRRALIARDGGCVWPGCDRPPAWTDAHHLRSWAAGGETSVRNLALVCRRHHVRLHEGGCSLVRSESGWQVLYPGFARAG